MKDMSRKVKYIENIRSKNWRLISLRFIASIALILTCSFNTFAQLSDLHYLPPLKQRVGNFSDLNQYPIVNQKIYLSTPETTPFDVEIYQGSDPSIKATLTISNSSPKIYDGLDIHENDITLVTNANVAKVLKSSGLIFKSPSGKKFYVNYRGKSQSHATSLTSKGRDALGTSFKWGGVPNRGSSYSLLNVSLGIMATEDNTEVKIFNYNPAVTFRNASGEHGLTDDQILFTLNKGESYVLEVIQTASNSANVSGWLGASITSTKNIAVSVGQLHMQSGPHGNQDAGTDQITPENKIGSEYVFVRGKGLSTNEYVVLVATENNTSIYINGSTTPAATIQEGGFYEVLSSNYSGTTEGSNMYVKTSQPVYAFQSLAGNNQTNTTELNFIAPVNCLLDSSVDHIVNVTDIAGLATTGGVFLIAASNIETSDINVTSNGVRLSNTTLTNARKSVIGTSDWVTFYLPNLTGNVAVKATGPIAVGFFGFNNAGGVAGYFSGFETIPNVLVQLEGDGCLPSTVLLASEGFTTYSWFKNGNLIPEATGRTYTPTSPGSYNVVVSTGTCTFESASQSIADCNPEIVLSVSADKSKVQPSETVKFTIKAKFLGFDRASDLKVKFTLPEGLNFQSSSPTLGTLSNSARNYEWNIGTLYNGQEPILTLTTIVDPALAQSKEITLTATNSQTGIDANKELDDASETVLLYLKPLPTLGKFRPLNKNIRDKQLLLKAPTSNSNGSFTFSSSNPNVATVDGNILTIVGIGSSTIKAQQASDGTYDMSFIETELIINESDFAILKTGEISATKDEYLSVQGTRNSSSGLNQFGSKLSVEKSPDNQDTDLVLWLDSNLSSSYNRKNNTWYDLSQSLNHGALNNRISFSSSNAKSFSFNGVRHFVSFEEGFPATDHLTIETWLYPTAFTVSGFNGILNHNDGTASGIQFQFSGNQLNFNIGGANNTFSTGTFEVNKWYHLVAVYSKSNQSVKFYVNGVLTNESSTGLSSPSISQHPFNVGSLNGTSRFFQGDLAILKIYTKTLGEEEVIFSFNENKKRFGF
jgi:uncharacterized repeat protein (TIGR01451 family)